MIRLTEFEQYALSCEVPVLSLPRLQEPTPEQLWRRAMEISYDLCREYGPNEKELVAILSQLGAFQDGRNLRIAGAGDLCQTK
jgi:hypothetical protein